MFLLLPIAIVQLNNDINENILFVMLRKISLFLVTFFVASCALEQPPTSSKIECDGNKCLVPEEFTPNKDSFDDAALSLLAEECLSCLDMLPSACLDEYSDCVESLSCKAWKDCNDSCVTNDKDYECYEICSSEVQDFFTPNKLKSCSCEICYAQCFNMCPAQ